MNRFTRPLAVTTAFALALLACGSPSETTNGFRVPTQRGVPGSTPTSCMAALIEGELVENETWGLILRDPSGIERVVVWPSGYSGRRNGRVALLDENGVVVAHAGDRVHLEGGEDQAHAWIVCADRRPTVIASDGP